MVAGSVTVWVVRGFDVVAQYCSNLRSYHGVERVHADVRTDGPLSVVDEFDICVHTTCGSRVRLTYSKGHGFGGIQAVDGQPIDVVLWPHPDFVGEGQLECLPVGLKIFDPELSVLHPQQVVSDAATLAVLLKRLPEYPRRLVLESSLGPIGAAKRPSIPLYECR